MSTRKLLLPLVLLAALARAAGCGSPSAPADAGVAAGVAAGPATGFSGPISPQGGTITGVFGSGALGGSALGGSAYVFLNSCPEGQTWVSLGSGSGYACASAGTPSTADEGDLLVQGSGELDGYAGSACAAGFVTAMAPDGTLTCASAAPSTTDLLVGNGAGGITAYAGKACSSGWATAQDVDGSLTCSTPTPGGLSHVVCYTTLTSGTLNDWSPTCSGGVSAAAADIWVVTSASGTVTLTGVVASLANGDGGTKYIQNQSGQQIWLTNGAATSAAPDRLFTINAYSRFIGNAGSFALTYQGSAALWTEHDESSRYTNNLYDEGAPTFVGTASFSAGLVSSGSTPSTNTFGAGWTVDNSGGGRDTYASQSGMSCGYATNASETCLYGATGYNNGTTQLRSWGFLDGEGSGSAHTIALFDAATHGLFVGSGNTVAEDLSSNGAPSGSCGSGSTDRDFASGGTLYICAGGTWEAAGTVATSLANHDVPVWDGTKFVAGVITDTGTVTIAAGTNIEGSLELGGQPFTLDDTVDIGGSLGDPCSVDGSYLAVDGATSPPTLPGAWVCSGGAWQSIPDSLGVNAGFLPVMSPLPALPGSGAISNEMINSTIEIAAVSGGTNGSDATLITDGNGSAICTIVPAGIDETDNRVDCKADVKTSELNVSNTSDLQGATVMHSTGESIGNFTVDASLIVDTNATVDGTTTMENHIIAHGANISSVSCTAGTAACASGATCSDMAGILNLTSADACTIHFHSAYSSTPACDFQWGSSAAGVWIQVQAQSSSSVQFTPENTNGISVQTGSVNYICMGLN